MIILSLRTDKPEAEVGVFDGETKLHYMTWQAHRSLAETIHTKIEEILNKSSISLNDVQGIVAFQGPGSFTGLRIGLSVANALAYSLYVPVVAKQDPKWLEEGIADLLAGKNDKISQAYYGQEAKTTKQKK
jgi:tRNA threonylcarbamoyladenosine biosynthesis protein TsaB